MLSDGYIPYKKLSIPRADNIGLVSWSEDVSIKRARQQQGEDSTPTGALDIAPGCPSGKKSCGNLGRPEICCDNEHTCLPTNNTLNGVYCCRSPDPINLPCDEENLKCDPGWYECPASANGGCCKYGQRCGLLQCFEGGGPTSPAPTPASTAGSFGSIEDDKNTRTVERTTIRYMPGINTSTMTITSASTSLEAATATRSRTSHTPVIYNTPTTTTSTDDIPTSTELNGAPITYTAHGTITANSAAGARAKVGRHWSWMVMSWWIVAAFLEGV
ncbi:uncharacterized protein H6S33_009134 [Morchella sextelata]|uniref:uncharacterized protein n=1 Tax=Morchella sextelata TaxID=1174677 RepID=UPI001D03DD1D|nr:uncharacterized protein H6S33_009134 [Morchella sextelata]KAH0612754.1 hypothetical protein H6S33_009134 [Morchella sextelata]